METYSSNTVAASNSANNVWVGNGFCGQCYQWPCVCITRPVVYSGYYHTVSEPSDCMGKAHVFECEHVESCKCGAIRRVMPKAKPVTAKKAKLR